MKDVDFTTTIDQESFYSSFLYEPATEILSYGYHTDLIESLSNTHIKNSLPSHDTLVLLKESTLIDSDDTTIESLKAIYAFMIEWYFYGIFDSRLDEKLDFNGVYNTVHRSNHTGTRGDIAITAYNLLEYVIRNKRIPNSFSTRYITNRFNEYCRQVGREDLHIPTSVAFKFSDVFDMLEYVIHASNRYAIHQTKTFTGIYPYYIAGLCSIPELRRDIESSFPICSDEDDAYYDEED